MWTNCVFGWTWTKTMPGVSARAHGRQAIFEATKTSRPRWISCGSNRSWCPCVSRLRRLKFGTWGFLGIWILVFGIFWAGCSVGPNYHAPKVTLAGEWSEPLEGGATNRTTRAAEWWTTFNDPKLNSLIVRALQ